MVFHKLSHLDPSLLTKGLQPNTELLVQDLLRQKLTDLWSNRGERWIGSDGLLKLRHEGLPGVAFAFCRLNLNRRTEAPVYKSEHAEFTRDWTFNFTRHEPRSRGCCRPSH